MMPDSIILKEKEIEFKKLNYQNNFIKQIGLVEKLQAYNNGIKSKPKSDQKDYGIGAQILRDLNIEKLKLISNNQNMNTSVINAYGLEVSQVIPFNV